jgi:cytochrome c-type biogenesis protein
MQRLASAGAALALSAAMATQALAAGGPAPGTPAPDFTLVDVGGIEHSLSDFRGKVVMLNFWASW